MQQPNVQRRRTARQWSLETFIGNWPSYTQPSGKLRGAEMDERRDWQHFFREVLKDPFVIFALGTALIVILLVPFFAMANTSS